MRNGILALSVAASLCAFTQSALSDEAGAVTGAVGGAAAGAVVGGVGGAAIGNSVTNHRYYRHPRNYAYHPHYHH